MYTHFKFWQERLRSLQTSNTLGNLIGKELSYTSQRASQWCVHSSVGRTTFAKKTHPVISLPPSPPTNSPITEFTLAGNCLTTRELDTLHHQIQSNCPTTNCTCIYMYGERNTGKYLRREHNDNMHSTCMCNTCTQYMHIKYNKYMAIITCTCTSYILLLRIIW